MTVPETLGLTSAYFGAGYFFGPLLVGEWILRRDEHRRLEKRTKNSNFDDSIGGFKATFSKRVPGRFDSFRNRISIDVSSAWVVHLRHRDHNILAERRARFVSRVSDF